MSITHELREYFGKSKGMFTDHVIAIADRIDKEHERAMAAAALIAGVPVTDENMAEHGWVRLPKDADGEYIRIGDVMEWVRYEDDDPSIVRKVSAVGAGVFFAWSDEQGRYAQYEAHAYRHCHAPTVEDVTCEFLQDLSDWLGLALDIDFIRADSLFAEYAAKLQLREDQ